MPEVALRASERASGRRVRLRRVESIMGTAIGIDVRDGGVPPAALEAAFAYLREIDERFSPYRSQSEVSRLGRGELAEEALSADLRQVLALCDDLARTTAGYFDARRWRADGRVDPTGLVKGWAVEEAALRLAAAGARHYALNAGGDVLVRGGSSDGRPWRIGIRHPLEAGSVAAVLALHDGAVATSGGYERGDHIVDPHTGRAPGELLSLSVAGPSLTYADAYATAAFAMGAGGVAWVATHPGYEAFAVTADRQAVWTPGLEAWLVT